MGAILAGKTTCGTLIGSSIAIGLYCGRHVGAPPEAHPEQRSRSIEGVKQLYADFIKTFGATDCLALCYCDFSNPGDVTRYIETGPGGNPVTVFLISAFRNVFK